MTESAPGRFNQRARTRKDLLEAASRLMKHGRKPSLEDVAEAALVSRATAYRYFQNADTLLLEASLDVNIPGPDEFFAKDFPNDPVSRLESVDDALHQALETNETAFRMMLIQSLERGLQKEKQGDVPLRQNRRLPLIDAALSPALGHIRKSDLNRLRHALALVIGTEAFVVCKDVLRLSDAESRDVRHWTIRALLHAASKPAASRAT